jgi:hypothetical protein
VHGLKIRFSQESGSSTLPPGTKKESSTLSQLGDAIASINPLDLILLVAYSPPPSVMKIQRVSVLTVVSSCCPSFNIIIF